MDKKEQSDALYTDLLNRDHICFWKSWNSLNRVSNSLVSQIGGETHEKGVAEVFATYFEFVYGGSDSPKHEDLKMVFNESFSNYFSSHINDDLMSTYFYLLLSSTYF